MILGLSTANFTLFHVALSLIGILSGLVVVYGMISGRNFSAWTGLFLLTTVLTSVTGFFFPVEGFDPARILGALSLALLAVAVPALYVFHLSGQWRWLYIVTSVTALYLNCFVAVVQSFQKLPFLRPLAPTQSEPPFVAAQAAVLVIFCVLGILAVRGYPPQMKTEPLRSF